jgi:Family of unknown function (DUF6210)
MIVDLSEFPDLGLIIKLPTDIRYTSQTAGFACEHPEVEGVFVPLRTRVGRPELATLSGMFRGAWNSLGDHQADSLDAFLKRCDFQRICVDRSKLTESTEAWVHVTVSGIEEDAVPLAIDSSEILYGILVWPNSD